MRTAPRHRALLAALLGLLAAVLMASPVGAQDVEGTGENEPELDHAVEECIHELEEANSIDVDCQEAPSPILPELNEIIWGAIGFFIVFLALAWKGVPAIKGTMNERTEKIRGDLAAAESARTEAESTRAGYQSQLADARQESARILEEARQQADAVRAERIAAIEPELQELRTQAQADAEATRTQALSELRGEVASLALGAAERVVERNLDDETNRALIDSYIDQVGASR